MGKIVSVYEQPSGTNLVREPRFDCMGAYCIWLKGENVEESSESLIPGTIMSFVWKE
jgi:hypothetical protein